MLSVFIYILIVLGAITLFGVPLIILNNKQPVENKVALINIAEMPNLNKQGFEKFTNDAKIIGFEKVIEFSAQSLTLENYNILYVSPDGTQLHYSQMKTAQNKWFNYHEFCTKFSDGTELNTRSARISGVHAPNPKKIIVDYHGTTTLPALHEKTSNLYCNGSEIISSFNCPYESKRV